MIEVLKDVTWISKKKYSKRDLRSRAPNITSGANLFSLLKVGWLLRCFQSSIRLGEGFPLSLVCFLPNLTKHIYARVYLTSMGSNLCNFLVGWLLGFQSSIRLGKMCPTFCELILPNLTHLTDWALELIQNAIVPFKVWYLQVVLGDRLCRLQFSMFLSIFEIRDTLIDISQRVHR